MDAALIGGLSLVALVWGFAFWLRRKALRREQEQDREFESPVILDIWNRGGPGPGP